jgi:hypothetical protein
MSSRPVRVDVLAKSSFSYVCVFFCCVVSIQEGEILETDSPTESATGFDDISVRILNMSNGPARCV